MKKETTKEYIKRYRKIYNEIICVKCEALLCEIKFSSVGFKHLIYKGSRRRLNKILKNRLKLIPLAKYVLINATEVCEIRLKKEKYTHKSTGKDGVRNVRYDAIEAIVSENKIRVRVVVRTVGEKGEPHFYSIMKY